MAPVSVNKKRIINWINANQRICGLHDKCDFSSNKKKKMMFIWEQTNLKILKANFSSAAGVCLKSTNDWGVKLTFDTVNLVDCYFKGLKYAFITKLSQIKNTLLQSHSVINFHVRFWLDNTYRGHIIQE